MSKTQNIVLYILIVGVLFLVFTFVAQFTIQQSIVLAAVIAVLLLRIEYAIESPTWKFHPYYVAVAPKWFEILTDYKLIRNPEEWGQILESFEKDPQSGYNVLRNGIHITVLHQAKDYVGQLIYVYHGRNFVSEVDFEEEMKPTKVTREHRIPDLRTSDVRFFMKSGFDGHDLGIILPDWWWEENKKSCPTPEREYRNHPTAEVRITLATIPYREFDLYWWAGGRRDFYYNKAVKLRSRRDEQRAKFGWTKIEHPDLPELSINWAESIAHKYFEVKHREI